MSEIEKYYNGEIEVDFDKETIKITQPMFEPGELESFDNYIHSIVEEYSKMKLHEKEQILTQRIIMKQEEEIERQKEVINGMIDNEEKYNLEIIRLKSIIKEVREYIEKNSLYEQDYDYDYEENLYEYPPNDEQARKDILEILDKGE